jgi:hypothetical protein
MKREINSLKLFRVLKGRANSKMVPKFKVRESNFDLLRSTKLEYYLTAFSTDLIPAFTS